MSFAATFTDVTTSDSQGPIGSLMAGLQLPGESPATPSLSAAGPAASMVSSIDAAQQAEPPGASLLGVANELQQEAARAELAQQHLAAQLQTAGHLGELAGAAQGSGLRVQVVGGPAMQW